MSEYESPLSTIKAVSEYLTQTLPYKNKGDLKAHLTGLEALRLEVAEKRVDWLKMLQEKENQMLHPKDTNLTELDRKTMLHASTAVIRRDYEFLGKIEEIIKDRLELGKLLLN